MRPVHAHAQPNGRDQWTQEPVCLALQFLTRG
jgi:hypothetical protein